jgi:hypothetical protein
MDFPFLLLEFLHKVFCKNLIGGGIVVDRTLRQAIAIGSDFR